MAIGLFALLLVGFAGDVVAVPGVPALGSCATVGTGFRELVVGLGNAGGSPAKGLFVWLFLISDSTCLARSSALVG
jgi:hypothetical protein